MDFSKSEVLKKYPNAYDDRGVLWTVYRDPSLPYAKSYLGRGVTKVEAWESAYRNVKREEQGWVQGTAAEFLGLPAEEEATVDARLASPEYLIR